MFCTHFKHVNIDAGCQASLLCCAQFFVKRRFSSQLFALFIKWSTFYLLLIGTQPQFLDYHLLLTTHFLLINCIPKQNYILDYIKCRVTVFCDWVSGGCWVHGVCSVSIPPASYFRARCEPWDHLHWSGFARGYCSLFLMVILQIAECLGTEGVLRGSLYRRVLTRLHGPYVFNYKICHTIQDLHTTTQLYKFHLDPLPYQ